MMRSYVCASLVLVAMGCDDGGNDVKLDAGAVRDAGKAVDASATREAAASLSATGAQMTLRIGATAPLRGNIFVRLDVSLRNLGEEVPLPASPSVFALETSDLLLYTGRTLPVDAVGACASGVEIERDGALACSMTFELPKGSTVRGLRYADDTGRVASAPVRSVAPAPSLCPPLPTTTDCLNCLNFIESTCNSAVRLAAARAACAADPSCISLVSCPAVLDTCTISAACQEAVDQIAGCYYDRCLGSCG